MSSNFRARSRPPGMRVEVLDNARFVHRPLDVSSRDAIPLRQLYELLDGLKTPDWAEPRQKWNDAVSRFKRDIRALFPETAYGSGVSRDWAKRLFIYPEPAHGSWKEVQELEGEKWEDREPTGQLWFGVRLATELKNIRDGNGVDEVDDLAAIHHDLKHVKLVLLGYRAVNVLQHNFSHASRLGYAFSDFLDLLNSISPPTLMHGHRIDEGSEDEFARYIATYPATLESETDGEAGWQKSGLSCCRVCNGASFHVTLRQFSPTLSLHPCHILSASRPPSPALFRQPAHPICRHTLEFSCFTHSSQPRRKRASSACRRVRGQPSAGLRTLSSLSRFSLLRPATSLMSDLSHTVGSRHPHERAHVFAAASETWRPAGISGRDAIPLDTFHRIIRDFSVPKWTKGDRRWKEAFYDFKRELTALFPATPEGMHEWNKLLFRYDRPAREDQRWPDLREFDEGRWKGHKRTGQLWFLHLDGFIAPLREVKHALLGVRAIFVLLHNFNKATTAGYSFNDFNDLLSSIAAPIHHDGEVLDADAMSELEAAVEEYKEEIRSKIRKAADWHNLAVMVRPANAAVLGTLYIAITVRNNKTSIESGRWNAKAIVKNAQVLSGSIDTIRQISESLPRAPGIPHRRQAARGLAGLCRAWTFRSSSAASASSARAQTRAHHLRLRRYSKVGRFGTVQPDIRRFSAETLSFLARHVGLEDAESATREHRAGRV
ncbi:RHTO0S23e01640g1_1 [Rhodotorula toruloides]|uniref:RHTO0S23e01640g1_1 n=1 Tax=Rhodotorula toruloides TaxID=5286 RepID=A0A061BIG0_RHOTO|nr:RHTO0S23e01640g1_1 [Rhodotorula toruloides]